MTLCWTVPNLRFLTGVSVYAQAMEADPAALFQYAFSGGIRLTLGP